MDQWINGFGDSASVNQVKQKYQMTGPNELASMEPCLGAED